MKNHISRNMNATKRTEVQVSFVCQGISKKDTFQSKKRACERDKVEDGGKQAHPKGWRNE